MTAIVAVQGIGDDVMWSGPDFACGQVTVSGVGMVLVSGFDYGPGTDGARCLVSGGIGHGLGPEEVTCASLGTASGHAWIWQGQLTRKPA